MVGLSTYDDENTERAIEAGAAPHFARNEAADRLLHYLLSIRQRQRDRRNTYPRGLPHAKNGSLIRISQNFRRKNFQY